jgi:hypothetical protein
MGNGRKFGASCFKSHLLIFRFIWKLIEQEKGIYNQLSSLKKCLIINPMQLHSSFLRTYFKPWIECISATYSSTLVDTHYAAGAEILFNADTLRQPPDQLFVELSQLHDIPQSCILPVLPRLLRSYISGLKKHRNSLYSGSDIDIMQQVRVAGMKFFVSCQRFLKISSSETWSSRASLLLIVEQENIFVPNDGEEAEEALGGNVKDAVTAILTGAQSCFGVPDNFSQHLIQTTLKSRTPPLRWFQH